MNPFYQFCKLIEDSLKIPDDGAILSPFYIRVDKNGIIQGLKENEFGKSSVIKYLPILNKLIEGRKIKPFTTTGGNTYDSYFKILISAVPGMRVVCSPQNR